MKALLISEDMEKCEYLEKLFRANYSKVGFLYATTAEDALDILSYDGPFGFIILDVELKGAKPGDLYFDVVDLSGGRPTLFIGSMGMIKDRVTDEMINDHVENNNLIYPFEITDFREVVDRALQWAKDEEFERALIEVDKEDYLRMKLRNFYLFNQIPYDAYWEVMDNRFIKIITKDKPYTHSLIQRYVRENGAKYLYLSKEDNIKFLEESMEKLAVVFDKTIPVKDELKTQIMSTSIVHQYLRTIGVSDSITDFTMKLLEYCSASFARFGNFEELLSNFPLVNKDFAEHSILTFYFCLGILDNMGWKSDMAGKKLGLASLIHDAALFNEEFIKVTSIDDPAMLKFDEKEREEFASHPHKSAEIATHFSGFPETDFIILQHHELPTGTGFPCRLNSHQITALSAVFILANNFVSKLFSTGITRAALLKTLKDFTSVYRLGNFRDPLKALEDLI